MKRIEHRDIAWQFTGRHPDKWVEQFGLQPSPDIANVKVYKSADGSGPALYFMKEDACKWFYELLQVLPSFPPR